MIAAAEPVADEGFDGVGFVEASLCGPQEALRRSAPCSILSACRSLHSRRASIGSELLDSHVDSASADQSRRHAEPQIVRCSLDVDALRRALRIDRRRICRCTTVTAKHAHEQALARPALDSGDSGSCRCSTALDSRPVPQPYAARRSVDRDRDVAGAAVISRCVLQSLVGECDARNPPSRRSGHSGMSCVDHESCHVLIARIMLQLASRGPSASRPSDRQVCRALPLGSTSSHRSKIARRHDASQRVRRALAALEQLSP